MKKGFTLVEVLIVVVIIAILASLIVPRMLAQTEKAKAAEAFQMMGVIKRAADRLYDFNGSYDVPSGQIFTHAALGSTDGSWEDLGLKGIENTKNFDVQYQSWGDSYEVDIGLIDPSNGWQIDSMSFSHDPAGSPIDSWTCGALVVFKPIEPTVPGGHVSLKGCTV